MIIIYTWFYDTDKNKILIIISIITQVLNYQNKINSAICMQWIAVIES